MKYLTPEDVLHARLACKQWSHDLGNLVDCAVLLPCELEQFTKSRQQRQHTDCRNLAPANHLINVFPYLESVYVDISSAGNQQAAITLLPGLVSGSKSKVGQRVVNLWCKGGGLECMCLEGCAIMFVHYRSKPAVFCRASSLLPCLHFVAVPALCC